MMEENLPLKLIPIQRPINTYKASSVKVSVCVRVTQFCDNLAPW